MKNDAGVLLHEGSSLLVPAQLTRGVRTRSAQQGAEAHSFRASAYYEEKRLRRQAFEELGRGGPDG